jgi:phosphoglycolate phosphatase-like HAD superfamily hydrolase
MNFFDTFDRLSGADKKWVEIQSELESIDGNKKNIKIEILGDGMPRAMAFFDIDGTLAHLDMIHGKAIQLLFPNQDAEELKETYYKGFRLGNSFREFDRMHGIYIEGEKEWKDPEFYLKNRFAVFSKEIDEPGNEAHDLAANYLKDYGEKAAQISDELFRSNPEEFKKSNIQPVFLLAKMFSRLGIPMVGFTANAKVFVEKLAKYLELSDIFLDIATDEIMSGGGKEIAIPYLIKKLESKGLKIQKDHLIFVGDSLRGDIGTELKVKIDGEIVHGQGILVLRDKKELIEIKKLISKEIELKKITESINIFGLMVEEVPKDKDGSPMFLSRFQEKFMEKL